MPGQQAPAGLDERSGSYELWIPCIRYGALREKLMP